MPEGRESFKFEVVGALSTGVKDRWVAPFAGEILEAKGVLGTAGTATGTICDVQKAGVSLYTGSSRSVTDGATNSNTTVTSATAAFVAGDVGSLITGVGLPAGTTITVIGSATSVTVSAAATATATNVPLTITSQPDNRPTFAATATALTAPAAWAATTAYIVGQRVAVSTVQAGANATAGTYKCLVAHTSPAAFSITSPAGYGTVFWQQLPSATAPDGSLGVFAAGDILSLKVIQIGTSAADLDLTFDVVPD